MQNNYLIDEISCNLIQNDQIQGNMCRISFNKTFQNNSNVGGTTYMGKAVPF